MNNINSTNDFVIVSETLKKYNAVLTEFNSIFLGIKHNIALTTEYASSSRIKLICKYSGKYRDIRKAEKVASKTSVTSETLPGWERKHEKDKQKHGCPCFMYANTTKKGKLTVRSRETQHNHAIEEDRRAYAMHHKLLPKAMTLVVQHLKNNDNQHSGKSDKGRKMFDFITTLQDLDFYVRYSVGNMEDNQINMIFFVHQDAINGTNSHQMTYVNIVGTSNVSGNPHTTLKTFPIAGAWVDHEIEENYLWVISCLCNAVWPDVHDNNNNNNNNNNNQTPLLSDVFITDNEKALRNAIT
ncbi:hypothetical protein PHYBLDRAFT_151717 [Phycomyces blakesleeanus NRRL 1555(-)]|uniref:MULE transposase domain-containing protein n=1 Tax=Phycomyces blakesleeanus (strain ATCC 8743b / DSM 1359 / FGSC 10004 / NBRC 33097 / NRRL 1555) TaxID=763407 RepID=A0A162TH63_PHYB8|nr:hypothetical protein PHYBLDRAFT_151717 [Phycomyces blakesleeanus NRRL 1555(-)]OAD67113.1 hypothetical protein PHYBLDRAFT_151717 [Phycomyces blakesleeanus NRRL 1555(-)]|eukprot:XP_018285153.1 hypothetical protein PHYBLDRAFT_151717 [Phycomyces blakesleeanus NRRL 1555(-)]